MERSEITPTKITPNIQITFGIYDSDGNKLGTAMDNIAGLGAGETWKFSAIYLGSVSNESYKLEEITGY